MSNNKVTTSFDNFVSALDALKKDIADFVKAQPNKRITFKTPFESSDECYIVGLSWFKGHQHDEVNVLYKEYETQKQNYSLWLFADADINMVMDIADMIKRENYVIS